MEKTFPLWEDPPSQKDGARAAERWFVCPGKLQPYRLIQLCFYAKWKQILPRLGQELLVLGQRSVFQDALPRKRMGPNPDGAC